MVDKTIAKCAECGYPLAAEYEGQVAECPLCGTVNKAISQGVTIPTWLLVGGISFGLGMLLGPSIIAGTSEGRKWLEEQTKGAIRK